MDKCSRLSAYSLQHLDLDGSRTSQSLGSRSPKKTDRTSACPKLLETERRQGPAEHLRPDLAGHVVKAHLRYPTLYWIARGAAEPLHGRYTEREQLLKRMEQYRTWLSQGTSPVYHYDCYQHGGCVYRRQALELALSSWLKDKGMDLTEPPDSCLWTMSASDREAWRQRPRSLVDRILREQLIAWQEVYQEASQICAEIQRVIDRTEQSRRRCEAVLQDERSSETEKTEAVRILDEVNRVNPLIDSGVMNKRNFFYIDEIWQIRTDMDNRSSIDAAINALLLWIGDIPSLTAEHRLIYRQDQDKVNAYKEWKSLMRKQFSTSKEKHGSYDAAAIAEEIRTTIKSIMVPKIE